METAKLLGENGNNSVYGMEKDTAKTVNELSPFSATK